MHPDVHIGHLENLTQMMPARLEWFTFAGKMIQSVNLSQTFGHPSVNMCLLLLLLRKALNLLGPGPKF